MIASHQQAIYNTIHSIQRCQVTYSLELNCCNNSNRYLCQWPPIHVRTSDINSFLINYPKFRVQNSASNKLLEVDASNFSTWWDQRRNSLRNKEFKCVTNYRSMGDTKGGAEWRITSWCEEQYEARSIPHYPPKADYSLYSLGSGVY